MTHNKNGRFTSFKSAVGSFLRKATIFTVSVGVVSGIIVTFVSSSTVTASVPEVVDNTPAKIAALKTDLVTELSSCEAAGHDEDYGLVTFDQNKAGTLSARNTPSFGILQFKVPTVQTYYKMQTGKDLDGKDAILLALDAPQAKALAAYIIFEKGGLDNWHNCAVKLNLAPQVTVLNKL